MVPGLSPPVKSVLITGGTGSFGQAFARLACDLGFERICILSRGEHKQAEMRARLANDGRLRFFIGDVRDRDRLRRAFEGVELVVHAAALKRVEVCEYDPIEVARTNVLGAVNVIEASMDAGVRRVVALSTDKAVQPVNAYGASKLLAERLFLAANNARGQGGPIFAVTRYGNIAGSNGSVIPLWREAKACGIQPRMTDPDCTRFWMTLRQACDLVMSTAMVMRGGELAIPDLPAYRLGDLAEAMGVRPTVIGLGSHEKKHETMDGLTTSADARRMAVPELKEALAALAA